MGNNQFRYTPEQIQFIRDYYPSHGALATAQEFLSIFGIHRTANHIRWCAEKYGIKVTKERLLQVKRENIGNNGKTNNIGKISPIGAITITKKTGGEPYIKTEQGWMMLKRYRLNCKSGIHYIVHLDGNVENCDVDNLMIIDRDVHARMTANHFWSEDAVLTKTGIVCCMLESDLVKNGVDVKKKPKQKPLKGLICKTNTGKWHISKHGDKYRVHIRRGDIKVNRTAFTSLEDAVAFRDSFLKEKGIDLVDDRFTERI